MGAQWMMLKKTTREGRDHDLMELDDWKTGKGGGWETVDLGFRLAIHTSVAYIRIRIKTVTRHLF